MIGRAVARVLTLVTGSSTTLTLAAEPESALLATAAALRRLGARITRYDGEAGTLEAKQDGATMRFIVTPAPREQSELRVDGDEAGARRLVRRLRAELERPSGGEASR